MSRPFHKFLLYEQSGFFLLLSAVMWVAGGASVHALDDIPEGTLWWVQGYDGNQPTGGFRVDGTLRIEAPDEPQPVGINLSSGRIEVGPTGEILVKYGPGGSRFINGDVSSEGLVSLKSVLLFSRDGAEWVNRGPIEAATYMGLGVTGKGAVFRQVSGEIRVADPSCRFEFYNESRFVYEGGKVFAQPLLVASSARVEADATQELSLRFLAQGSSFEGRFPEDLSVAVASDETLGPASLMLTNVTSIEGLMELTATSGSPGVVVQWPEARAVLAPRGVVRVKPGAGLAEIRGGLALQGLLDVQGSARWTTSGESITNWGKIRVPTGGRLQASTRWIQAGGSLQVEGGELGLTDGLMIDGGTLAVSGTVSGSITNGALSVVDQAQPARVRGDWTQTSAGTLQVRVRQTSGEAETALQVQGPLTLRGTLEVLLADGVTLSRGAALRLVQAESLNGWFERLVLPPLDPGLHWRVVPSEEEVRLSVQDTPPPIRVEWISRDAGDRIRVSGPWSPETQAVLRVSGDLKTWTSVQRMSSFAGLTWFPVPKPSESGSDGLRVYRATLGPVGSPD
jgi:hypothetical protein